MSYEIIGRQNVFRGTIFNIEKRVIQGDNQVISREVVVKNPVVVCIVEHVDSGNIIVAKEYRAGVDSVELGLVAGIVDDGEEPIQAAVRETIEETGYTPTSVIYLGESTSSAGFTNERAYHFYIEVSGDPKDQSLDGDESIEIEYIDLEDIEPMILNGEIKGNHAHAAFFKAYCHGIWSLNNE